MSQIKVNTYAIQIRERDTTKIKNKYLNFESIIDENDENFDFIEVFKKFVTQFDTEFIGSKSTNKAMRLTKELSFNSAKNTISGFFKAGFTGEQKEIFEKNITDDKSIFTVKSEHVNTSEYYFVLWLPKKSATGVLMIQGTSNESAGDLFKTLFHIFLNTELKNKTVKIDRYTSKKTIENFKKKSKVQKIVLAKNSYDKDLANEILGQTIANSNVKLKIVIEGDLIQDKVLPFINKNLGISLGDQPKFFTSETLDSLKFGEADDYDTAISLIETETSKAAIAKSKSGFEIKPFTYINENIIKREKETNKATRTSLKAAIDNYFESIKSEIL